MKTLSDLKKEKKEKKEKGALNNRYDEDSAAEAIKLILTILGGTVVAMMIMVLLSYLDDYLTKQTKTHAGLEKPKDKTDKTKKKNRNPLAHQKRQQEEKTTRKLQEQPKEHEKE